MPLNPHLITWRRIEEILIELLREEGFEIIQERGNRFITVEHNDGTHDICLADFAQQLKDRL